MIGRVEMQPDVTDIEIHINQAAWIAAYRSMQVLQRGTIWRLAKYPIRSVKNLMVEAVADRVCWVPGNVSSGGGAVRSAPAPPPLFAA